MEVLTQQLGAVGITVNSRSQDLTTWLDTTWAQGDYGMSEIRDSANILQYGCEGGREPLGKSSSLCIPEFEDQLAVADSYIDNDEYLAAMSDLVKTFADLAWVTVISAPKVPMLMRADLEGIQEVRINNGIDFGQLAGPTSHPGGRAVTAPDHSPSTVVRQGDSPPDGR